MPALKATSAATVQLSVPVITAVAGIAFLDEPATLRLALASVAILGGIGLVICGAVGRVVRPTPAAYNDWASATEG